MWSLLQDCVSVSLTHFNVVFFSFALCIGVTQLVFGLLPEKTVEYVAIYCVCLWDEVS